MPAVVGLPGSEALARLRAIGYEHIAVFGRWSNRDKGVILALQSGLAPTQGHDGVAQLVASMGPRDRAHGPIFFPGVATCDLGPLPSGAVCAGGPVLLVPR
jgi:hypothetical protein